MLTPPLAALLTQRATLGTSTGRRSPRAAERPGEEPPARSLRQTPSFNDSAASGRRWVQVPSAPCPPAEQLRQQDPSSDNTAERSGAAGAARRPAAGGSHPHAARDAPRPQLNFDNRQNESYEMKQPRCALTQQQSSSG
ncbi:Hypothetical protein SMAX5B_009484 [Scophthalmus maximus]|uniref:Uncharacterized protein n=1 Tax=Scophthalmus maximus TaxID=52904 RepID=A0A2U9BXR7_SCOMX|nr:Hypothetical protein SMAX5B_009484 [Scophthalmus maximus]KAF0040735.1 hypothetical protein F2P81_006633 [Scophthalmus maximus]